MRYISLDIETTGLLAKDQYVLQIGAVADAWDGSHLDRVNSPYSLNLFITYGFDPWQRADDFVMKMHKASGLYDEWHTAPRIGQTQTQTQTDKPVWGSVNVNQAAATFRCWLNCIGFVDPEDPRPRITVAGKNVASFDMPFLRQCIPNWNTHFSIKQRVLDPGILYLRPTEDQEVPDQSECLKRAGLPSHVSHDAVDDARQVIQLLRHKLYRR